MFNMDRYVKLLDIYIYTTDIRILILLLYMIMYSKKLQDKNSHEPFVKTKYALYSAELLWVAPVGSSAISSTGRMETPGGRSGAPVTGYISD